MAIQIRPGQEVMWNPISTPCIVEGQENGRAHIRMMGGIPHFILDVPENELTPLSSGGRIPPPPFLHQKWTDESEWPHWSWILWPLFIALLIAGLGFGIWIAGKVPAPPWLMVLILGAVIAYTGRRAWK